MADRYVRVAVDDAVSDKLDGWQNFDDDDNAMSAVYLTDDYGRPVELIGWDGGEPEDQNLYRDWAWVVDALNTAYKDGLEAGREHCD